MDEGGATPSNGPDAYTRCKGLCVLCGHSQLSLRLCAGPLQSSDGDLSVLPVPSPCPPTRCLRAHTLLPLPMTYSELVLPSLPCPVRCLETLTASTQLAHHDSCLSRHGSGALHVSVSDLVCVL